MSVIRKAELCVGMRLHSLIYAVGAKVPVIGLVYDAKVAGFMDYINQSCYLDAENISSAELIKTIDDCILRLPRIKEEIGESLVLLKEKAESNAEYAIKLLDGERGRRQ